MKTIGKILHFYVVCSTCCLILTWISANFVFDSYVMGVGIIITFFIWSPIYTLVLTLVHILKINTKILGNIYYEIIVSLLPSLLNYIYFTIAYRLTMGISRENMQNSNNKQGLFDPLSCLNIL